ncbi:MAG: ABC transporter ATP-binding protein [Clostridia bacterium]|jgi:putative ABC transport system ATP-binding protein|nr:ABC transporter ATP-binding protein [Clostridia bacterium]
MDIRAEGISRRYFRRTGEANYFEAVCRTDFTVEAGKVTVLLGRSGSGKTTLLHMLAGLLTPTGGKIFLGDTDLYSLEDKALSEIRNKRIGVIPQGRSVIDTLTVLENILLPAALYGGESRGQEALEWMKKLDIAHLADSRPTELSGGELRRVAIVRALAGKPEVILADEPTGDLDDENTALVLSALRDAARDGAAVLLVTHEGEAKQYADEVWRMNAGTLTREERN